MAKSKLDAKALAQMFRVLGDQNRVRILAALSDGEHNVTQLCKLLKMRQPAASHHLGILRTGGLVVNRRAGKEVFYSICPPKGDKRKSLKSFLNNGPMLRIGPVVLGMLKD